MLLENGIGIFCNSYFGISMGIALDISVGISVVAGANSCNGLWQVIGEVFVMNWTYGRCFGGCRSKLLQRPIELGNSVGIAVDISVGISVVAGANSCNGSLIKGCLKSLFR